MTASPPRGADGGGLALLLAAVRVRLGLVATLLALAGVGWWWSARAMRGMDEGPWTGLGGFGWFVGVWVVMMAAMMFPSIAPTVALHSRMTRTRAPLAPLAFTAGYLATWSGAGLLVFGLSSIIAPATGNALSWSSAGRPVAAATLLCAAAYELTPLKTVCLSKCHSPLGFLLGCWRDGAKGALRMGARMGMWCLGCCWALMASLFALGVMSATWMALVAGLISIEKIVPWRRVAPWGTAVVLCTLAVLLLAAPDSVPGLTVPHPGGAPAMHPMSS